MEQGREENELVTEDEGEDRRKDLHHHKISHKKLRREKEPKEENECP